MSSYSLVKLAEKLEKKYALLSQGQDFDVANRDKFKKAMGALTHIAAYLQHPDYKKLLGDAAVAATNVISLWNFLVSKLQPYYNYSTQEYVPPDETILAAKNYLNNIVQDIRKAVVRIEDFVPVDQRQHLVDYLNTFTNNVRDIEVFKP